MPEQGANLPAKTFEPTMPCSSPAKAHRRTFALKTTPRLAIARAIANNAAVPDASSFAPGARTLPNDPRSS
ncbi:hypothetical protein NUW54_g13576 [Trametes sanguinea]|uniref:Uncharacterized protein n=1 Tax=Trametes sanguinea TaxID=158606 RepID=A0ACC1MLQ0_9APHY|nr:hypothetical protein NUW54_g13576 [Trametes sanguinea]